VMDSDGVTASGERLGDGPADAARRPRYQNLAVSHSSTLAAGRCLA